MFSFPCAMAMPNIGSPKPAAGCRKSRRPMEVAQAVSDAQKTSARTSILSRGAALGGPRGSSNKEAQIVIRALACPPLQRRQAPFVAGLQATGARNHRIPAPQLCPRACKCDLD